MSRSRRWSIGGIGPTGQGPSSPECSGAHATTLEKRKTGLICNVVRAGLSTESVLVSRNYCQYMRGCISLLPNALLHSSNWRGLFVAQSHPISLFSMLGGHYQHRSDPHWFTKPQGDNCAHCTALTSGATEPNEIQFPPLCWRDGRGVSRLRRAH